MSDVLQRVEEIEQQYHLYLSPHLVPAGVTGEIAWLCQQVRRLVEERDQIRQYAVSAVDVVGAVRDAALRRVEKLEVLLEVARPIAESYGPDGDTIWPTQGIWHGTVSHIRALAHTYYSVAPPTPEAQG